MHAEKKYWAFLSYSHQDTRLCEWLHRELETFRVPTRLVGRDTREGKTPSRLFPVFRDRDELPGSSELGKNLTHALEQSRYLIVVCSPAAARSRWVNEEIRQFKAMGGEHRVLALIIDGEPNAADKPESGLLECFPDALKHRVDADGQLSAERVEPIAADIRKGRENRSTAVLRLIAGLLGVPFDDLRQRDQERKRSALAWRSAAVLLLVAGLAGVSYWKYRETRMERLEELGREAMMQSRPSQAAVYLAEAYRMGNDKRALRIMLDQAMRSVDMLSTVHFDDTEGFAQAVFSDDGTRLLASNKAGAVSVWRADNGQTLLQLKADTQSSRTARFLPGGHEIALLYQDGRIEILEARTGKLLQAHRAPAGFVPSPEEGNSQLALYQRLGAAADQPGSTLVYDLLKQKSVRPSLQGCAASLSQISDNGKNLYCVGTIGTKAGLAIVPLDVDGPIRSGLPGTDVHHFVASNDGKLGVASTGNGVLTAIDLFTQKPVLSVRDPAGGAPTLALSSDGQLLAAAGETGSVLVWSVRSGELVAVMAGHTGRIKSVYFLGSSARLATLGEDGHLKIWNTANATLISAAEPAQGYLVRAALSAEGERMATFAESRSGPAGEQLDPVLKVWDLLSAGPMESFGDGKPVRDSKVVASATVGSAAGIGLSALSPNGQRLLVARGSSACNERVRLDSRADNSLLVSSLTDKAPPLLLFGQAGPISTVDCDSDMQLLLTGGTNGDAILWSAQTAKPILRFTGHSKNIGGISFLPVPGQFATSGSDGTFQRWNFAEEQRRPLTISRRTACRIPIALEGYTLKPSRIDQSACKHERIW